MAQHDLQLTLQRCGLSYYSVIDVVPAASEDAQRLIDFIKYYLH
jgi:hypothetical protein